MVREDMAINPVYFNGLEEALSHRIIPAVTLPAYTLDNQTVCLQDLGEHIAGLLDASAGVEYQLLGNLPVPGLRI